MQIKPMPAHLKVLPIPDPQTKGGIILDVKTVRSLSPYIKAMAQDKGSPTAHYPMTEFVRDGQEVVMIPRGAGTLVDQDGVVLKIVHVSEVIGLFKTKENLEDFKC